MQVKWKIHIVYAKIHILFVKCSKPLQDTEEAYLKK